MNKSILKMDGVPFWKSDVENFDDVKNIAISKIYELEKNVDTQKYSNVNGYQSTAEIYSVSEFRPIFDSAMRLASSASIDMKFIPCDLILKNAWFNINRGTNTFNKEHVHGDVFSGVVYLKTPDGSGSIEFVNPAFNELWSGVPYIEPSTFVREYSINPKEGDILLFPSYLKHRVMPNSKDVERISMSFNISILAR